MKSLWISVVLLATLVTAAACGAPASKAPPVYDDYRAVLTGFVDENGLVDYATLRDQRANLDDFIARLGRIDPDAYEAWSREDKIAFWINAYNAITLRVVIGHYPVESIRDIPGAWDRLQFVVMGRRLTLDDIENQRIRRGFTEPRIHVALVCAAVSCPKLRAEPYEGERLDAQLDDQARTFLSDPRHFTIDSARRTVRVSEIFQWYAGDFADADAPRYNKQALERRAVADFAAPYLTGAERAFLDDARIEYAPYNWALNRQPR